MLSHALLLAPSNNTVKSHFTSGCLYQHKLLLVLSRKDRNVCLISPDFLGYDSWRNGLHTFACFESYQGFAFFYSEGREGVGNGRFGKTGALRAVFFCIFIMTYVFIAPQSPAVVIDIDVFKKLRHWYTCFRLQAWLHLTWVKSSVCGRIGCRSTPCLSLRLDIVLPLWSQSTAWKWAC